MVLYAKDDDCIVYVNIVVVFPYICVLSCICLSFLLCVCCTVLLFMHLFLITQDVCCIPCISAVL
jgi:hypothetical protein